MKITAEFNSNEELMNFISTFGAKTFIPSQGVTKTPEILKENKVIELKKAEEPKTDKKIEDPKPEDKKEAPAEDPKPEKEQEVTKEMVRAIFTTVIKAGKAAEAKALTAKYGASKVPEIKKEDYAAIFKEANALMDGDL